MPFSFPSSPTVGQESVQNGRTYRWTGAAWELVSQIQGHKASHATGGPDALTPADIGAAASLHTHNVTDLAATGTPSASTFLRGDGAWAAAGGSSVAVQSDTVGSTSYIGRAAAGSATSASVWTIRRTILTSAGAVSSTATATNVKWDDRLTATYS